MKMKCISWLIIPSQLRFGAVTVLVGVAFLGVLNHPGVCLATPTDGSDIAKCRGYSGPGGACNSGPGGGLYGGPGGGNYAGPGGGLYAGPGGGMYAGPGGGMYAGPGGGLYAGPGGGIYAGPGGGIYPGPPTANGYKGPWGPCITGVLGKKWMEQNCPF